MSALDEVNAPVYDLKYHFVWILNSVSDRKLVRWISRVRGELWQRVRGAMITVSEVVGDDEAVM